MKTFGERLKWIEKEREINRSRLSELAGFTRSWAGQVIRGDIKKPLVTLEMCESIAAAANVDPMWLLTGEGEPEGADADDAVPGRATIVRQAQGLAKGVPSEVVREALRAFQLRRYKGHPTMATLRADFLDDLENAHELFKGIQRRMGRTEDDVLDAEPEV